MRLAFVGMYMSKELPVRTYEKPRYAPSRNRTYYTTMNVYACQHCGAEFEKKASDGGPKHSMRYCSRKCCAVATRRTGPASATWKGGRVMTYDGYIRVRIPDHPNCDSAGYVLEHRYVMSLHLGRPLEPQEVVHHINGDKTDNRIENLELMETNSAHRKEHGKRLTRNQIQVPCFNCSAAVLRWPSMMPKHGRVYCSHACYLNFVTGATIRSGADVPDRNLQT